MSNRVPGGVVHKLPADLRTALIALVGVLAMPAAPPRPRSGPYPAAAEPLEGGSDPVRSTGSLVRANPLRRGRRAGHGRLLAVADRRSRRWHVGYPTYDEPKQNCLEEECPQHVFLPRGSLAPSPARPRASASRWDTKARSRPRPIRPAARRLVGTDVNEGRNATHLTGSRARRRRSASRSPAGTAPAAGKVFTSTAPASGRWQTMQLAGSPDLRAVSCATPSRCVAVAKGGRIFVSATPPAGPPPGARPARRRRGPARGLLRRGAALRRRRRRRQHPHLGRPAAHLAFSRDQRRTARSRSPGSPARRRPAASRSTTTPTSSPRPTRPATRRLDLREPRALRSRRTRHRGSSSRTPSSGVSCASPSLCVLVGANSRVFTATDPFAAPARPHPRAGQARPERPRTTSSSPRASGKSASPATAASRPASASTRATAPAASPASATAAAGAAAARPCATGPDRPPRPARPRNRPDRPARAGREPAVRGAAPTPPLDGTLSGGGRLPLRA